jgi:hypothetical protein
MTESNVMTVGYGWSDPRGLTAATLCHVQPFQSTSVVRWDRFKSIIPNRITRFEERVVGEPWQAASPFRFEGRCFLCVRPSFTRVTQTHRCMGHSGLV